MSTQPGVEVVAQPNVALLAFFAKHRAVPRGGEHPDECSTWYTCTCGEWSSATTSTRAAMHHTLKFEEHLADSLTATGQAIATTDLGKAVAALADKWDREADINSGRSVGDPNAYMRMIVYERVAREIRALIGR